MGFLRIGFECIGSFLLVALLLVIFEPVLCQGQGPTEVTTPALDLPIPIPTSQRFYEGEDIVVDNCPRDEVDVNGTCHGLLTQGPCQPSEFVLLDPETYEGYCAARLCAPDRIFVFSDQLCHDPFSSTHCPGAQELFQTAFGTPICQCPDGYLEGEMGRCVPTRTPTTECPAGQVCGSDPCGTLNLDRPLPSPPFVPSLADGTCHQLGQVKGVCPLGTFYTLDLESMRGVCVMLIDAGYIILDVTTQRLYHDLFGPFTLLTPFMSLPPLPLPMGTDNMLAATTGAMMDQRVESSPVVSQGSVHSGSVTTQITFSSIPHPTSIRQHRPIVFPTHHTPVRPSTGGQRNTNTHNPRINQVKSHNVGPVRQFKFTSLTKHFPPTHLDLAHLQATFGHNHLVRPFPVKGHRGATAPLTVPASLLAQTIINRNTQFVNHGIPSRIIFPGQTPLVSQRIPPRNRFHAPAQEAQEEYESLELLDSVAEVAEEAQEAQEEGGDNQEETETSRRRRALGEGAGLVETRLVTCRPGARRHINARCQHLLLPFSALPSSTGVSSSAAAAGVHKRSVRSASPLVPTHSCSKGLAFNLKRECGILPSIHTVSFSSLTF